MASFPSLQPGQTDAQRGPGVFQAVHRHPAAAERGGLWPGRQRPGTEPGQQSQRGLSPSLPDRSGKTLSEGVGKPVGPGFSIISTSSPMSLWAATGTGWIGRETCSATRKSWPPALTRPPWPASCAVPWSRFPGKEFSTIATSTWPWTCPYGGRKIHVSEMEGPPPAGTPIRVGDHCYACTAGSGFS